MPCICYYIKIYIHKVDGLGNNNGKFANVYGFKIFYTSGVKEIQDFKIFINT